MDDFYPGLRERFQQYRWAEERAHREYIQSQSWLTRLLNTRLIDLIRRKPND